MNSAPGAPIVNVGSTRQSTASVQTVASAVAVPSALNDAVPLCSAPTSRQIPTIPLVVIITAANTVSRASVSVSDAARDHQRHDQRDLDHGHGDREHERAERLADPVGDHLGVMDRRQHRAGEQRARDHEDDRPRLAAPGRGRQHGRDRGDDGGPARRAQESRPGWQPRAVSRPARRGSVPGAALEAVAARPAREHVVAVLALEAVVAVAAVERVGARAAVQPVVAGVAE